MIVNFEETDSHLLAPNVHPDQTRNPCSQGTLSTGDDAYGYFNLFELPDLHGENVWSSTFAAELKLSLINISEITKHSHISGTNYTIQEKLEPFKRG